MQQCLGDTLEFTRIWSMTARTCNIMQWTDMNRQSLHKNIQQTQPASTLGPLGVQSAHVDMDMIWIWYGLNIDHWFEVDIDVDVDLEITCCCLQIFKLIIDSTGVFLWSSEIAWAISLSLAISYSWLVLYWYGQSASNKQEREEERYWSRAKRRE